MSNSVIHTAVTKAREHEKSKTQPELDSLRHFFALFKSYNPNEPMSPGMRAEFLDRRSKVEVFK